MHMRIISSVKKGFQSQLHKAIVRMLRFGTLNSSGVCAGIVAPCCSHRCKHCRSYALHDSQRR
jgi:hypothetical protein